jgi:hypothetical protein
LAAPYGGALKYHFGGFEMTERENFFKVLNGKIPEWVPNYFDAIGFVMPMVYQNKPVPNTGNPNKKIYDILGMEHTDRERYTDMLGIDWTIAEEGSFPTPGIVKLKDITKWREQLNLPLPDLDKIDFKAQAEGSFKMVNRDEKVLAYMLGTGGRFVELINLMGVEEGLCALYEEPEAIHELFTFLTDFDEKRFRLAYPHFKPDIVVLGDDVATQRELFISPEMYDEMIAPYHRRMAKVAQEYGCILEFHCCGKSEKLVPYWLDMGVKIWQIAQADNDLLGIRAKYGNSLIFNGGWKNLITGDEAVVRKAVRDTFDKYATGGGFIFWDKQGDPWQDKIITDEARKYGKTFYKKA